MKKLLSLLLSFFIVFTLVGCQAKANGEVTIVYTNDVHTYVNNEEKDDNGNVTPLLQYGSVKAIKDDLVASGKEVLLLDAGDHVQGSAFGGIDEGKSVVEIMNEVGYDAVTMGNHEFDYGQVQAFNLMQNISNYPYLSCNFYNISDGSTVFDSYKVFEKGGLKIAVVGISTPETITKSAPAYFQDGSGNYIYGFYGGSDGKELYDAVQKAVNKARKEADVVVALGHLGVDEVSIPWRSIDVIENTTGIDAFIDGHSHTEVQSQLVKNKNGEEVLLTQTGEYLSNVGVMTISVSEGVPTVTSTFITEYDKSDESINTLTSSLVTKVQEELGKVVCSSEINFITNEPGTEERIVRKMETNSGDLIADGYYWYFNEIEKLDADVAIANGGGIRADINAGDVTLQALKTVQPYGNVGCVVEVTGQMLLDALEFASRATDGEKVKSNEVGGFLHVAGAKFTIDTTIESTVQMDAEQVFTGSPTGEYRVKDLQIYNKQTGTYEPVDLNKNYTFAGINYILRNSGDGFAMLSTTKLIKDYCDQDYLITAKYCEAFKDKVVSTKNSPLSSYSGYLLDYENPYGAGRITIIK